MGDTITRLKKNTESYNKKIKINKEAPRRRRFVEEVVGSIVAVVVVPR